MAKRQNIVNRIPLAPVVALMFGMAAATVVALTPPLLFDGAVAATGMSRVLAVAQPPLGLKAHLLAIVFAFAVAALVAWLAGALVERSIVGTTRAPRRHADDEFDLSPFAVAASEPRRTPILAGRELGAPLMSDAALGTNGAPELPDEALHDEIIITTPSPDDSALAAPLAVEEFELAPLEVPLEPVAGETSIDALIRRLEAGLRRRDTPLPPTPPTPPGRQPAPAPEPAMLSPFAQRVADRGGSSDELDEDTTRALGILRRMAAR